MPPTAPSLLLLCIVGLPKTWDENSGSGVGAAPVDGGRGMGDLRGGDEVASRQVLDLAAGPRPRALLRGRGGPQGVPGVPQGASGCVGNGVWVLDSPLTVP